MNILKLPGDFNIAKKKSEKLTGFETQNKLLFLLIFSGIILFIIIAFLVTSGSIQNLDDRIFYGLRSSYNPSLPAGPGWLIEISKDLTSLGNEAIISLLVILVLFYFVIKKDNKAVFLILSSSLGSFLLDMLLKNIFLRERPGILLRMVYVATKSFPSGHAMVTASVYFTLSYIMIIHQKNIKIKNYIICAASIMVFFIGISRLYLGVHYLTDILAGWTAGLTWAIVCLTLSGYFHPERKI